MRSARIAARSMRTRPNIAVRIATVRRVCIASCGTKSGTFARGVRRGPRRRPPEVASMARAIWKGRLLVGEHDVPVKLYSAVEDRKIRFRLLHEKDAAPAEQRIVRKDTGKEVEKDDRRKAYP